MTGRMTLLPPKDLRATSRIDHADWNYRPVLGYVQRRRFSLIRRLMGERRFRSLLEIGYGSGIFLPELARHADNLVGIDVHEYRDYV